MDIVIGILIAILEEWKIIVLIVLLVILFYMIADIFRELSESKDFRKRMEECMAVAVIGLWVLIVGVVLALLGKGAAIFFIFGGSFSLIIGTAGYYYSKIRLGNQNSNI